MNRQPPIDRTALKQAEKTYRKRLGEEPGDTGARLRLAWCLVLQAFYRAGQESLPAAPPDGDARDLLKDGLQQTVTVTQLSADPREHREVETLRALVRLSGAEPLVLEAEERAARILSELTRALRDSRDATDSAPRAPDPYA
jgi:hypothetical protein